MTAEGTQPPSPQNPPSQGFNVNLSFWETKPPVSPFNGPASPFIGETNALLASWTSTFATAAP